MSVPPEKLAICPDDDRLPDVGVSPSGEQVLLTQPFTSPSDDGPGCEYIALYVFDVDGALIRHTIRSLGPRATLDADYAESVFTEILDTISPLQLARIDVRPFSVWHDGVEFGLVPNEFEGDWWVEMQPGNYVAFVAPWDSGDYDT